MHYTRNYLFLNECIFTVRVRLPQPAPQFKYLHAFPALLTVPSSADPCSVGHVEGSS